MTTSICILVGVGAIILFMGAALAFVLGVAWLDDRFGPTARLPKVVERALERLLLALVVLFLASVFLGLAYLGGCEISCRLGWIDDCPTCEVEESEA